MHIKLGGMDVDSRRPSEAIAVDLPDGKKLLEAVAGKAQHVRLHDACRAASDQDDDEGGEKAKRAAFRMAEALAGIIRAGKLRKFIGDDRPFETWLEEQFAPAIRIGCDPRELLRAVTGGMTLDEYMATPGWPTPPDVGRRISQNEAQAKAAGRKLPPQE